MKTYKCMNINFNGVFVFLGKGFLIFIILISFTLTARTEIRVDTDGDRICDDDEINIYRTDPENIDTDGDGFDDWEELNNGYSPLLDDNVKLEDCDYDEDGLSDRMELNFHTDLTNPDTDGDGFLDGEEIENGYNPRDKTLVKLAKRIEVNTGIEHELSYFLGGVRIGKFPISAGLPNMPTPKGHFKIETKHPNAWSSYGLWMPYWMNFKNGKYGIHQLPYWSNGAVEGEESLGKPASHGCVRLGKEGAKAMYDFAEIGTEVFIY